MAFVQTPRFPTDFPYISIDFSRTGEPFVSGKNSCFLSLTHNRKVDKANQVEINAAFAPSSTQGWASADDFEKLLVGRLAEITFQYGYQDATLPPFETLLTDYTVTMDNGVLNYTLKGISGITAANYNFATLKYPQSQGQSVTINGLVDELNKLVDDSFNKSAQLTPYKVWLDPKTNASDYDLSAFTADEPLEVSDTSLMGLVKEVVNRVNAAQGEDAASYLMVYLDERLQTDIDGYSLIKIKSVKFTTSGVSSDMSSCSFVWNAKNSTVLSWSPSFSGKTAIFGYKGEPVDYLDARSGVRKSVNPEFTPGEIIQNLTSAEFLMTTNKINQWWSEMSDLPYNATLEVLGNPDASILLGDYIDITVFLGNDIHHSSGVYMVRGITDSISTNGFITKYDLLKTKALKVKKEFTVKTSMRYFNRNEANKYNDRPHYEY